VSLPPFIGTAFVQDDAEAASKQWRQVADRLRPKVPKLAALMEGDPEKTAGTHGLAQRVLRPIYSYRCTLLCPSL
jgi:hypothetical protein